jgi:hypothetical protein
LHIMHAIGTLVHGFEMLDFDAAAILNL